MLLDILRYKRPAWSNTENEMIKKYIDVLPNCTSDGFGNRIVQVGDNPVTMFSCHTDTVHHKAGYQKVMYDKQRKEVFVQDSNCLGADDTAGIIIMINMIKSGINGLYVFHRAEEIGGKGSQYIADKTPELLEGIQRCVAFDRRGTDSVITHQFGERCCSDDFAEALCQELMRDDLFWFPDSTGVFTDSAHYTEIIPECTNLSCGYDSEHTKAETLDVEFLQKFMQVCINVDWDNLPTVRDPNVIPAEDPYKSFYLPEIDVSTPYNDVVDFVYDFPVEAAEMLYDLLQEKDDRYWDKYYAS